MAKSPVTLDDVHAAQARIKGHAIRTPMLRNDALDAAVGARVLVKAENLQVTGTFKIRGATNRIAQLSKQELAHGVVAFSSGNHAQGVARAARRFVTPATIVMPTDSPAIKIEGVRRDGTEIVFYDRARESREEIALALAAERGATLIPSFDDPHIVAGQGTMGAEIAEDLAANGAVLDHFICCTGGGGLISGSALALKAAFPGVQCWTAEPAGFDDWARSLKAGKIQANAPGQDSICDAILTPQPGEIPFAIGRSVLAGGFVVSDAQVRSAMRFAFTHLKLVVEPGGAVALAAALFALPDTMRGATIAVVISGGNVDADLFADVLAESD